MNDSDNPFRAPVARVLDHVDERRETFLFEGRRVPAGHGYRWLTAGWTMFRAAPGTWIGIALAFMAIMIVFSFVPLLNLALNLLVPVLAGGISIGCRAIEDGEDLRFAHLFAGFTRRVGNLLLVGLLYLLAIVAIAAVVGLVAATTATAWLRPDGMPNATLIVIGIVVLLLALPLAMAVWLAPPLVIFHEVSAFQAMKTSCAVALRNLAPFAVYSVVVLLAAIAASLPLMLGWLVLLPVIYGSLYACYRDVFFAE